MMPSSPSTCPSFASPSTCLPLWSPLETPKHFRPPPALRSSASAEVTLPAPGAGLLLPSPPASSAYGQVWTARCLGGPPPPLSLSGGWQPDTGVTLAAPGTSVPPSRQPSPPPVVIPPGAGLLQLASLQQPSTLESAKCVQLQGHRPLCLSTRERSDNRGFMLSPPGLGLLQLRSRATRTSLFSRNFATNSGPPAKKMVEFAQLSPHLAPASVGSQKVEVYRKLKEFEFGFINPHHMGATIADDTEVTNAQFDVSYLKKLYDDKVKDILIASGIFVDPSDETYLAALDAGLVSAWGDVFDQTGPLYLTTLDVMRTLVALHPCKWRYVIDFLRDRKILVIENWDYSLGSVETMMYNHGVKYPVGGRTLYMGQIHSSFKHKLKAAALCGITWNKIQVLDCLMCPEIVCKDSIEAGLLSAYMILRRALHLKIEDFVLYTHSDHVGRVLREEIIVKYHEDLSRILVGLKARFKNIFCQSEPREKILFPDSLLSLERAAVLVFEEILRIWSPHLLGLPVFRIHQKRHEILKDFISKQASGGKLTLHHAYKVKLNVGSSKLDGLRDVVMGMLPRNIEVLVRDKTEAVLVKQELKNLFRKRTLVKFGKRRRNLGQGYEVSAKRTSRSTNKRTLRIILHSSMEDVTALRIEDTITVKLLAPEEDDDSIGALRPECFLFFNGKPGVLLDIEKKC